MHRHSSFFNLTNKYHGNTAYNNMGSVQKVSSHAIWKIETFTEEDTRYKQHCTQDNEASVPFKVGTWDLTQFSQLPSASSLYFPKSHQQSEISSISKVILVLGKARSHQMPNLGCRGAESSGWFDVSPKNCTTCDAWADVLLWWSCPSPVAQSCSLLNHPNSFHRGMFELDTKVHAHSLLYSVSHFECNGHTVHMLTQRHLPPPLTSTVK